MGTLEKILESNVIYGPPPIQPVHNRQLRAGLRSLCKYNFDRKDYSNQETKTKTNKILAKSTMATFTKSTKKMERKPDENTNVNADAVLISTGIKFRAAKPAPPAPLLDETASSEDKTASSENFSARSIQNPNAISISAGIKPREAKPALPAPLLDETAPSEDIYFDASDEKMPSEDIPNPTNAPVTESVAAPAAAGIFVFQKT
jgi:hypothetical protein